MPGYICANRLIPLLFVLTFVKPDDSTQLSSTEPQVTENSHSTLNTITGSELPTIQTSTDIQDVRKVPHKNNYPENVANSKLLDVDTYLDRINVFDSDGKSTSGSPQSEPERTTLMLPPENRIQSTPPGLSDSTVLKDNRLTQIEPSHFHDIPLIPLTTEQTAKDASSVDITTQVSDQQILLSKPSLEADEFTETLLLKPVTLIGESETAPNSEVISSQNSEKVKHLLPQSSTSSTETSKTESVELPLTFETESLPSTTDSLITTSSKDGTQITSDTGISNREGADKFTITSDLVEPEELTTKLINKVDTVYLSSTNQPSSLPPSQPISTATSSSTNDIKTMKPNENLQTSPQTPFSTRIINSSSDEGHSISPIVIATDSASSPSVTHTSSDIEHTSTIHQSGSMTNIPLITVSAEEQTTMDKSNMNTMTEPTVVIPFVHSTYTTVNDATPHQELNTHSASDSLPGTTTEKELASRVSTHKVIELLPSDISSDSKPTTTAVPESSDVQTVSVVYPSINPEQPTGEWKEIKSIDVVTHDLLLTDQHNLKNSEGQTRPPSTINPSTESTKSYSDTSPFNLVTEAILPITSSEIQLSSDERTQEYNAHHETSHEVSNSESVFTPTTLMPQNTEADNQQKLTKLSSAIENLEQGDKGTTNSEVDKPNDDVVQFITQLTTKSQVIPSTSETESSFTNRVSAPEIQNTVTATSNDQETMVETISHPVTFVSTSLTTEKSPQPEVLYSSFEATSDKPNTTIILHEVTEKSQTKPEESAFSPGTTLMPNTLNYDKQSTIPNKTDVYQPDTGSTEPENPTGISTLHFTDMHSTAEPTPSETAVPSKIPASKATDVSLVTSVSEEKSADYGEFTPKSILLTSDTEVQTQNTETVPTSVVMDYSTLQTTSKTTELDNEPKLTSGVTDVRTMETSFFDLITVPATTMSPSDSLTTVVSSTVTQEHSKTSGEELIKGVTSTFESQTSEEALLKTTQATFPDKLTDSTLTNFIPSTNEPEPSSKSSTKLPTTPSSDLSPETEDEEDFTFTSMTRAPEISNQEQTISISQTSTTPYTPTKPATFSTKLPSTTESSPITTPTTTSLISSSQQTSELSSGLTLETVTTPTIDTDTSTTSIFSTNLTSLPGGTFVTNVHVTLPSETVTASSISTVLTTVVKHSSEDSLSTAKKPEDNIPTELWTILSAGSTKSEFPPEERHSISSSLPTTRQSTSDQSSTKTAFTSTLVSTRSPLPVYTTPRSPSIGIDKVRVIDNVDHKNIDIIGHPPSNSKKDGNKTTETVFARGLTLGLILLVMLVVLVAIAVILFIVWMHYQKKRNSGSVTITRVKDHRLSGSVTPGSRSSSFEESSISGSNYPKHDHITASRTSALGDTIHGNTLGEQHKNTSHRRRHQKKTKPPAQETLLSEGPCDCAGQIRFSSTEAGNPNSVMNDSIVLVGARRRYSDDVEFGLDRASKDDMEDYISERVYMDEYGETINDRKPSNQSHFIVEESESRNVPHSKNRNWKYIDET